MRAQVAPLLESIEAMGIPLLRIEGVEADDVIGTLARAASRAGRNTVISTGDKDLAQLVDEHVTLVNTMDDTKLDRAGVQAKFGVTPEQIIDYLALVGDPLDNIPGIDGVGPKTAAKWLQQYPDSRPLKAHAADVPGKIGERLRASLDTLDLAKELATIRCDVELPLTLEDLHLRAPDVVRLSSVFERLEFGRLLRRVRGDGRQGGSAECRPRGRGIDSGDGNDAARQRGRGSLRDRDRRGRARSLDRKARDRAARGARRRDDGRRLHARRAHGALVRRARRAKPLTCRSRTAIPARPSSSGATRCSSACARGSRAQRRKSGTISSTTRTCSRTTASRSAVSRTTRCSSRTC